MTIKAVEEIKKGLMFLLNQHSNPAHLEERSQFKLSHDTRCTSKEINIRISDKKFGQSYIKRNIIVILLVKKKLVSSRGQK